MRVKSMSLLLFVIFAFTSCTTEPPSGSSPVPQMTFHYIEIENNSGYPVVFLHDSHYYFPQSNHNLYSETVPPHSTAKGAIAWGIHRPMLEVPADYTPTPSAQYIKALFLDAESNVIAESVIAGWPEGVNDHPDIAHYGFGWIMWPDLPYYVAQDGVTNEYPYNYRTDGFEPGIVWPYPDNIFDERASADKPYIGGYFIFSDMKITITDTNDITVRVLDVYNTPRSNG